MRGHNRHTLFEDMLFNLLLFAIYRSEFVPAFMFWFQSILYMIFHLKKNNVFYLPKYGQSWWLSQHEFVGKKNVLCSCVLKYVINAIRLGWFVMPFSSTIQFWFWFFPLANLSISNKKWLKYFNSELNYFFIQFIILLLLSYYHLLKYNGL